MLHLIAHADAASGDAAVSIDRERAIDPVHGLVMRGEETQTVRAAGGVQVTRTTAVINAPVR